MSTDTYGNLSWTTKVCLECLLCRLSGCVSVCHLHTDDVIRRFHAVSLQKTWTEAQRHCREKFIDLATILDQTNNTEAQQVAGSGKFWIGLSYISSWKWSQEDQEGSMETWSTNWTANQLTTGRCVTISGLGDWSARDCGAQHHMMCYNGESDGFSVCLGSKCDRKPVQCAVLWFTLGGRCCSLQ